jgi:hypothetical protein
MPSERAATEDDRRGARATGDGARPARRRSPGYRPPEPVPLLAGEGARRSAAGTASAA